MFKAEICFSNSMANRRDTRNPTFRSCSRIFTGFCTCPRRRQIRHCQPLDSRRYLPHRPYQAFLPAPRRRFRQRATPSAKPNSISSNSSVTKPTRSNGQALPLLAIAPRQYSSERVFEEWDNRNPKTPRPTRRPLLSKEQGITPWRR
jgi:hypothetical protein